MIRSVILCGVFGCALVALFGYMGRGLAFPDPPIVPAVEWKWDTNSPALVKTDKQIGGKDVYKLAASGILIFDNSKSIVNEAKSEFWVYVTFLNNPTGFGKDPNQKFKVKVGAQTKLPPTNDRYYYPISVIATIDGKEAGDPHPYFNDQRLKVVPVLTYTYLPPAAEETKWFTEGYAQVK